MRPTMLSAPTLRSLPRLALLASALLLPVAASQAAELRVPQDFSTIQAAVDAASPGDVITVGQGIYAENVVVTTSDVVLRGHGATIDGQFAAPCLFVVADDVDVTGFALLNGGDVDGVPDVLAGAGARLVVRGNTVTAGVGGGIVIVGDDAVVEQNLVTRCGSQGILVVATLNTSSTEIARNHVSLCGAGIAAQKGRLAVTGNVLASLTGSAIDLDPSIQPPNTKVAADVQGNRITRVGGVGIDVDVSGAGRVFVLGNRLSQVGGVGVDVDAGGADPVDVVANRIGDTGGDAIQVASGGAFFVAHNRVRDAGADGISVKANGVNGGVVEKNVVRDARDDGVDGEGLLVKITRNVITSPVSDGIEHTGDSGRLERNVVRGAGSCGLRSVGNSGTLAKNSVSRCGRDGLFVSGSSNVIDDNDSRANGGDGIDLEELGLVLDIVGNTISGNRCLGNAHEGIDATGLATVIVDNTALGNGGAQGPDIAGAGNDVDGDAFADGTVATFEGNTVSPPKGGHVGGSATTPQRLDVGEAAN